MRPPAAGSLVGAGCRGCHWVFRAGLPQVVPEPFWCQGLGFRCFKSCVLVVSLSSVRPPARPSVRPSVRPSARPSGTVSALHSLSLRRMSPSLTARLGQSYLLGRRPKMKTLNARPLHGGCEAPAVEHGQTGRLGQVDWSAAAAAAESLSELAPPSQAALVHWHLARYQTL